MIFRLLFSLVFLFGDWRFLYAEIKVIPEREYCTAVNGLIVNAESSIEVEMYLVYSENLQVKKLLDKIVEAKEERANRYFVNPLWSKEELQQKWDELIKKHGWDLFDKARKLAERINDPLNFPE